jgi:2-haloacid dehalogenase
MTTGDVQALIFDVFGTCVDWRTSVAHEVNSLGKAKGVPIDGAAFADEWRKRYQPSMETVRSGKRPWTILDTLHRESLDALLPGFGLADKLTAAETDHLNRVWHRLSPWPDTVEGLTRLKHKFIIAPHSNGNLGLLVNMAKHSGLPWDAILGAEVVRNYKPVPQSYQDAVKLLGRAPGQVMMVAAHNDDLAAAQAQGLKTAFVARPTEYGPHQAKDFKATGSWDVVAQDFVDLAQRLGA